MTPEQIATLRAAVLADPAALALYNVGDRAGLSVYYNAPASPDYWVWRTNVSRDDLYHKASPTGSTWNWNTYKAQSVAEQGAWEQMFANGVADFALPNFRAGVAAIFQGSAAQNTQRDHCLAVGRRLANRVEKVFATGDGSTGNPSTMSYEGGVTPELFIEV